MVVPDWETPATGGIAHERISKIAS